VTSVSVKELPVPPSVKGRATMRALLDAAREVLVRDGYVGARVSDISSAAGLSNGAFYRYFTDKQQIMLHVIAEFLAVSRDVVHVPFDPHDPMVSVRASTERYFDYYAKNAPVWRAVIEAGQIDPDVEAIRLREIDDWCARITHMLERGVQLGLVRDDINCAIAAYLLGLMVQGYAQHAFRVDGLERDPAILADEVTKLWQSGAFRADSSASRS
jgi:AcrR family transcriptional regulator